MKVLTLTLPLHTNYGGLMQAYALQQSLISSGCDTKLINISAQVHRPMWRQLFTKLKRFIASRVGRNIVSTRETAFKNFISQELRLTERIDYKHQLRNLEHYDAVIVGSDQVWRPEYANDIGLFFFDFVKKENTKRLSYAASFGNDEWTYSKDQEEKCRQLISIFDNVSVREQEGVKLCRQKFGLETELLLDPTMLISKSEYNDIITRYSTSNKDVSNYVFSYILDDNEYKRNIIDSVSSCLNIENHDFYNSDLIEIGDWLKGFRDSSFVITDSFHGVVFSIIFGKPFIAIANKDRGVSRFTTILSTFNMLNRLKFTGDDVSQDLIETKMDHELIMGTLREQKKKSIDYLKNSLENEKDDIIK